MLPQADAAVSVQRSFCCRVSHREYEHQKSSTSQECIAALLDRIVADKSMPAKVKKQRLKTVRKADRTLLQLLVVSEWYIVHYIVVLAVI